jgi:hypothetical protein
MKKNNVIKFRKKSKPKKNKIRNAMVILLLFIIAAATRLSMLMAAMLGR